MHSREHLIVKAKEVWRRKQEEAKGSNGSFVNFSLILTQISWTSDFFLYSHDYFFLVVTDPEDPRFDLERLLIAYENASS